MYGLRILFLLLRFSCFLLFLFQQHGKGLIRGLSLMLPLSLYFNYVADRFHIFGIKDLVYLICFDPLLELILTGDLWIVRDPSVIIYIGSLPGFHYTYLKSPL